MTSHRNNRIFPALAALALAMATGQAISTGTPATPTVEGCTAPSQPLQVMDLRRDHAYRFVAEGDSFRRSDRVDASSLQLPAQVVCEARGTYVQIGTADGPIWLERMQLVLDQAKQVKADCRPGCPASATA